MMNALVYTHTFSDGSIYFGNAVNPDRPYTQGSRGGKYQAHYEKYGEPVIAIIASGISVEEADEMEVQLFDEYRGLKLQRRPQGDLAKQINRGKRGIPKGSPSLSHREAISAANLIAQKKPTTRAKKSESLKGRATRSHRLLRSSFNGHVTIASHVSRWNKKNPNYIGTWVEVKESEAANG